MKKYDIEEWEGKKVGTLLVTGKTKGRKWQVLCDCGSYSFKMPSELIRGTRKCRECYYESMRGSGGRTYAGIKDIPATVLTNVRSGAKKRARRIKIEITLQDIQDVYDSQGGLCAFTGVHLRFGKGQNGSVDRIDSSKHYTRSNIQLVDKRINIMKMALPDDEFIRLCGSVSKYREG